MVNLSGLWLSSAKTSNRASRLSWSKRSKAAGHPHSWAIWGRLTPDRFSDICAVLARTTIKPHQSGHGVHGQLVALLNHWSVRRSADRQMVT